MLTVELIYDASCPHIAGARAQLLRAFVSARIPARWQEWQRGNPDTPRYANAYGSPTVLVNGKDIDAASPSEVADCCRLYRAPHGTLQGIPSVEQLVAALQRSLAVRSCDRPGRARGWRSALSVLPGMGMALLPKVACPACWPAYAGFLSSLGLGFLLTSTYLFPLTALFLAGAVLALGYRARQRRGYRPCILGTTAAVIVLFGKFVFDSNMALYGGILVLVGASFWNTWPKKKLPNDVCPACVAPGSLQATTQ